MEVLIGIVLVLLAFKLLIELFGFFIGYKVVKDLVKKDEDKQYEDIHAIYSSHDCNNNNIGGYMMYCSLFIIGMTVIGYLTYLGMKATGAL